MPGFVVNGFGAGAPSTVKPYYKYTWEVVQIYGDNVANNLPLLYVVEASLPSWDIDKEEVLGTSVRYKFAKSINWNDIKITWYDTVGLASKIREWRRAVWTPEGGMQPADQYKRQSMLRSLTFSWDDPVGWNLINSWPAIVKTGDLTYTESSIKQVDVTLVYDWAEEILGTTRRGA